MINRQLLEIKSSMQFHRDYFRLGVKILFVFLVINFVLLGAILFKLLHQPVQHFYATTTMGNLVELTAYNQPVFMSATS